MPGDQQVLLAPAQPKPTWTPPSTPPTSPGQLEEGRPNIVISRGYSGYGTLRWKIKTREREYLTRLCRALIDYGAPAHHLEDFANSDNLNQAAVRLGIDLSLQLSPETILLSFSNDIAPTLPFISGDWESIHLGHLARTYHVHDMVLTHRMTIDRAIVILADIAEHPDVWSRPFIVFVYGLTCAVMAPLLFGATPIDIPIAFCFGCCVGLVQRMVTPGSKHRDVLDLFVIASASGIARALGSISGTHFCFSALAQAPLVLLLPGFTIASGCLQLTSGNKGTGSSRIVFAIAHAVILGFAFTVGAAIYGSINTHATSQDMCSKTMPTYFAYLFLIPFVTCVIILSQARWRQIPMMVTITCSGYFATHFLQKKLVTELANFGGAFTLGTLVNIYSALRQRSAAQLLLAGLFVQIPSGLAAHGSLVEGVAKANVLAQTTLNGTAQMQVSSMGYDTVLDMTAPVSMARVAIMIALGLRLSSWLAYTLGQRRLNC